MGDEQKPTPENMTMMQGFEWYVPADHKHWIRLEKHVPQLKSWGIDNIWIPPGCKGSSKEGNGYDIYDLYDLGEFDQKGTTVTKWGSFEELMKLAETAKKTGVGLYWDAVLNHKFAADHKEKCLAQEVDQDDRTKFVSDKYEIDAWVGFDFPGRGDKYSPMKYHWYHFSGVDYNAANNKTAIYKIMGEQGEGWAAVPDVDSEKGNYDFLMGSDLDYSHPEVEEDVLNWGKWLASTVPLKGFRFDAIKHYSEDFLRKFITKMDETYGQGWFVVGEFWKDSLDDMTKYLDRMGKKFSLFDAPLVYNFSQISQGNGADIRQIFDDTLVQKAPMCAVTLVMNHDTQPYQALEAPVADWFKPLAYALILLRIDGYPCVWYGDLYGIKGEHPFPPSCGGNLPKIMLARKLYAYGKLADYFDYATCIGWVRYGTWDRPYGCATVLSNAGAGTKRMHVGEQHAGEKWTDVLGWSDREVEIGEDGFGEFVCGQTSVSIFVNKDAEGRDKFAESFDSNIYEE
ncbi:putative alpha-amylase protein [Phaeoacremonium minimum UCRPA7]|uniref:Putative alpha-amylase protein n=1 Tax=Phaeoacremonium minimum (strain UCR-PA7) TaxID=1286976 RepID=R8BAF6_PHAM7|nr:putative alpha-amylase protein [Phaeoacremonium minimum UCRPA7]EON96281.1 putative alpha-amylase protein [Phaeoacremonium minimum UCRPA7]